jgi:hypothetical protein
LAKRDEVSSCIALGWLMDEHEHPAPSADDQPR